MVWWLFPPSPPLSFHWYVWCASRSVPLSQWKQAWGLSGKRSCDCPGCYKALWELLSQRIFIPIFEGLFGFVVCLNLMLKYLLSEVDASSIQLVCCIEVGTSEGHKRDVSVSILGHLDQFFHSNQNKIQTNQVLQWGRLAEKWKTLQNTSVLFFVPIRSRMLKLRGWYSTWRRGAPDPIGFVWNGSRFYCLSWSSETACNIKVGWMVKETVFTIFYSSLCLFWQTFVSKRTFCSSWKVLSCISHDRRVKVALRLHNRNRWGWRVEKLFK